MRFRFSLETVLRLRQSLEDSERLRLQALLANRAQLDRAISETASSRTAVGDQLKTSLRKEALSAGEMHFAVKRLTACELQTARLNASLNTLSQQVERQQEVLLRRRLDHKVLEQLRTGQLTRFEREQQHRAQAQMEELFLLRRGEAARSQEPTDNYSPDSPSFSNCLRQSVPSTK